MCGIAAGGARPRGVLALHAREMLEDLDSLVLENGSLWWPYGVFIIKGWHNYEVKLSVFFSCTSAFAATITTVVTFPKEKSAIKQH